ncbi:MAG: FtsW/RodA/SpoVE family cell cycle protein [Cellulosilyticaceae bacterium]
MAYLNLMILLSRYIFIGFAIVFVVVAFSFMKPFISYNLGKNKHKNTLLYLCISFFHLGATCILIGKTADPMIQKEILLNSVVVFSVITVTRWVIMWFKRQDQLVLWHLIFFLMDVGYIMLERLEHGEATKQVGWIIIGILVALAFPYLFKPLIHHKYEKLYLIATFVFIVMPFIWGEKIYGAINWVQIGPIGFQPSEFAKITFIMYLASALHDFEMKEKPFKTIVQICALVAALILGLVIQRDLGGAMLYFLTFLILLYVGTRKSWLSLLGLGAGGLAAVAGYFLFGHVRIRVEAWLNPWADIENKGYQVVQGLFAIGTWGWLGSGLTRGIPEQIPIVTTDYIFPAICEEFGNMFGILILLCYLGILLQGLKIALVQLDNFSAMLTIGIVVVFGLQALIILGGVLKVIPLTGITLPFVSYGGSSMLTSLSMIGILGFLLSKTLKVTRKEDKKNERS